MKIAVAGTGYVGLSLATLLSQEHEVVALDILEDKVDKINRRVCPIQDEYISDYFDNEDLNLRATLDYKDAFEGARFVIISTPTNYDDENDFFDTSMVEDIIEKVIEVCDLDKTTMIIKSTIPVGFTEKMKEKHGIKNIIFSPEFLREGKALYDNLYPSRIIVGDKGPDGEEFAELLKSVCLREDVPVRLMNPTEAEAVKLFANTFLALRVSYFNELDTYAELKGLNSKDIIEGVCLDPRIGNHYNNPSFGYGGYCLPKDTKQLLANYEGVPQTMIRAIVESNEVRKQHIADMIIKDNNQIVGVYRLTMKSGSDNFRESAIQGVIEKLLEQGLDIIIYEPTVNGDTYNDMMIEKDLDEFINECDVILANRMDSSIEKAKEKVYTRDIYSRD